MKLTHLKASVWFKFSLVIAGLMLVSTILFKLVTPPPATPTPKTDLVEHNYNGSQSSFTKVKFDGTTPKVAKYLDLMSLQTLASGSVIEKLKKSYQLQAKGDNFWIGPDYTLYFDAANNLYVLGQNHPPKSKNFINLNQALQASRPLVKNLFSSKLEPELTKVRYLTGTADLHETQANLAHYISISFSYRINQYPLLVGQDNYYPLTLLINADQTLQKLTFKPMLFNMKKLDQKPSLSVSQAVNNINHGLASIIATQNKQTFNLSLTNITQARLTKVVIEYRSDQKGIALPYYHFSGEAKNEKAVNFKVDIITPALKN